MRFSSDAASAKKLYAKITSKLDPKKLILIDHYLGKEPVIDLMNVRLSGYMEHVLNDKNSILECIERSDKKFVDVGECISYVFEDFENDENQDYIGILESAFTQKILEGDFDFNIDCEKVFQWFKKHPNILIVNS